MAKPQVLSWLSERYGRRYGGLQCAPCFVTSSGWDRAARTGHYAWQDVAELRHDFPHLRVGSIIVAWVDRGRLPPTSADKVSLLASI